MKKTLFCLLMLLCLPGLAPAQKAAGYRLGKWYAGVMGEAYQINMRHPADAGSWGAGWGVSAGRHLSPHFRVRLGLVAARQQSPDRYSLYDSRTGTYTHMDREFINTALYAPLTLHYVPFGSRRRWQPCLSAGLNTLAGSTQNRPEPFSRPVADGKRKVMFNWRFGLGARIRLVRRTHLSLGGEAIGSFRHQQAGAGFHAGLDYDFGSRE